jgi:DNA invertase Pin-like site-specific DNA recombinase
MATRPLLTDRILPRVESIRQELEAASMNSVAIIYENSERFERIKTDLDRLIETVRAANVRLEISTQPIHEGNSNAYRN